MGIGAFVNLQAGAVLGVGEGVSTEFGAYVLIAGDFYYIDDTSRVSGKTITFKASEEFRSSDNTLVAGEKSDVFIGASFSMVYALTDVIDFNWTTNQVERDTSVAWDIDSVATTFIYTESHIRNTLIPQLRELRNLALGENDTIRARKYLEGIDRWNQELEYNRSLKRTARFERNISFSAGASLTYSSNNTSSITSTRTRTQTWDVHWQAGLGAVILGCTYEIGAQGSYYKNTINDTTLVTENSVTTGYSLGDDDAGDFFSVNVKRDATYGTPVFDLLAGTSSCPWEPGTQPRDGVQLDMSPYVRNNVPPDEPAAFILSLGNTSQSGESREYYLSVIQSSNLDGAIIRVGGVVIEDHLSYTLPAGEQLTATMTVERGPIAYDYENLKVRFYSPCNAEAIADTVTFSVHFQSNCSDVTLLTPENHWVVNQSDNDTLQFILTDYNLNNPYMENLKLQYRRYGESWQTAFLYPKSTIPPEYIFEYWDVSALPDGNYELRAVSDCGNKGLNYSDVASGVIDRQALLVFGTPQPSDGVLNLGENISISFSDEIDENYATPQNISLVTRDDSVAIPAEVAAYQNTLVISVPLDTLAIYSNRYLTATVSGIRDINGNTLRNPVSWSFRISTSPVYWTVSNADRTVYQRSSETFTRTLRNSGSQDEPFTITRHPVWLTPGLTAGTIPPGGETEISFAIDSQLNPGSYQDTVFVHTNLGEEQLLVRLKVLIQPPQWTVNPAQFNYSMNVTAQVVLNDTLSQDIFDILSVFVQDECRGTANIEYVPSVNKYMAFLTLYSNTSIREILTFHAWDASQGREQVFSGDNYTFSNNGSYGTTSNPVLIVPDGFVQTVELNIGWTWISPNVECSDMSIATTLLNLSPDDGDLVKGQTGFCQYQTGVGWQGSLQRLEIGESYRVFSDKSQTLRLTGSPVDIPATPIFVDAGWNWIGYLPQEIMDINNALAAYTAMEGDRIRSQTEFAEFLASSGQWEGSLKKMIPGQGYLLNSQLGGTVNYPSLGKPGGIAGTQSLAFPEKSDWEVNIGSYEHNISITALLEFDGTEMADTTIILGAFVEDTCRGLTRIQYIPGMQKHLAFLLVYSNHLAGDSIHFRIYEPQNDKTRPVAERLAFRSDDILGNVETPFLLTALGIGDELIPTEFYLRQNYPNPFNPVTTIEYGLPHDEDVSLVIFNALGQKVKTLVNGRQKADRYKISFSATELRMASGIYFYRLKAGKITRTRKLLLIK